MWWAVLICVVLAAGSVGGLAWWAWRNLVLVTVNGESMEPALRPGDRVLVRRRGPGGLRIGDIVVIAPPQRIPSRLRWNIKRVAALPGDPVPRQVRQAAGSDLVPAGALVVRGDHHISVDSRQLGFYQGDQLLGVVVRRLKAPAVRH